MKSVIFIDKENKEEEKPVEFTHILGCDRGWDKAQHSPSEFDRILYLGKCVKDGDMFSAYHPCGSILIFKGHLNSGKY